MPPVDRAAQCRAAREAFELAMQLGCTPRQAQRELRRRRAAALQACGRRFQDDPAVMPELAGESSARSADFRAWDAHWMMRD